MGYTGEKNSENVFVDTVTYEIIDSLEIQDYEPILEMVSNSEEEIAIKDETLQVEIEYLDTFIIDSTKKDSLEILEILEKKDEGEKLRTREEIQLKEFEQQKRNEKVDEKLEQLENQHLRLDSLLLEKSKK